MQKVIANEYREENLVEVKVDADSVLARYLIIFSIDIRNHITYNVGYMKKKEEYCYTQCRVGCNKQTKHAFVNTGDKTQIILACCECVLKKEKKVCGTRTQ